MRKATAATAALVLVMAGCGGDENGGESGGETLQDFLGVGGDDPEAAQAQFAEEQRELEEHVAECMAAEGFEYVPQDDVMQGMGTHPRQEMEADEFRDEYGYGLTTIDPNEMQTEAPEDPNQEIVAQMDDAEREAYQEALHGEMPEPDPDADPDEPVEFQMGGCRGEAEEEVRGEQQAVQQELGAELQQLFERVQSDPRIVEAQTEWAACMRDHGWEFEEQQDTFEYLVEQQNELMQDAQPAEIPDEVADLEPGEEPPEDFEPPPPPEPDADALAELQEEELELAEVDHECQVEHFGGQDEETMQPALFQEVFEEYEREFVEEHRDVLEQLSDD